MERSCLREFTPISVIIVLDVGSRTKGHPDIRPPDTRPPTKGHQTKSHSEKKATGQKTTFCFAYRYEILALYYLSPSIVVPKFQFIQQSLTDVDYVVKNICLDLKSSIMFYMHNVLAVCVVILLSLSFIYRLNCTQLKCRVSR